MLQILEGAAVIAALSLYLIPSIEADARQHRDAFAITLVNVLLGWTVVGWFAARAWARRRHDERLLTRATKRIRIAAGRVTSQKMVDHVELRAALAYRANAERRVVKGLYS
jgi:uncharacterized membrane protein YbhN (UPF0104 family)